MASIDSLPTDSSPNVTLTIRLIMQGKEVGSIIGKKGDIVKRFREESGAKINISDGSCPERIVTVTGNTESIFKAFTLICNKFDEDLNNLISPGTVPRPPITFRLVVPASQCGSLIGKGGSKIKEIREVTGASVQVASEMLPNSTERAVTISGNSEAVIQCIYHICVIMSESPPKGVTVPYTPLKAVSVAGLNGVGNLSSLPLPTIFPTSLASQAILPTQAISQAQQLTKVGLPMNVVSGVNPLTNGLINPTALALLSGQARNPAQQQTHEMTVPNELIGCIIGKGGSKVAEIRQLSGAMIRISNCEDRDAPANLDRTITITGNAESVALAQYLINMSMEVFRANLQLMEEQQITAAAVAMGQPTQPQPSALQVASAGSASASLGHQMSMSQPRLLLATDHAHNLHQLGTEMATPTPNPGQPSPSLYAIAAQSNITNNNTLQYPGNIQQQTLLKTYTPTATPTSISVPNPASGQGSDLTQTSYMYHPLCATAMPQPRPLTAASPAPAAPPTPAPIMISNKLKAAPTLISIQSARDHKFMPY